MSQTPGSGSGWQLYECQQTAQIGPPVEYAYTAGQNNGQIERVKK